MSTSPILRPQSSLALTPVSNRKRSIALSRSRPVVSEPVPTVFSKAWISSTSKGSITVGFGLGGSILWAMFLSTRPSLTAHPHRLDKLAWAFHMDFGPRGFCSLGIGSLLLGVQSEGHGENPVGHGLRCCRFQDHLGRGVRKDGLGSGGSFAGYLG